MKGKQKQHSIFLEMGRKLTTSKPQTRKHTYSFFQNPPTNPHPVMPIPVPQSASYKNSGNCKRRASLPFQAKKVIQPGLTVGMND